MRKRVALLIGTAMLLGMWVSGNAAVIHFDDREGMAGPFEKGQPIPLQYMVDDEYLNQGVIFNSDGGGIRIARAGNAISGRNLASGTAMGPHNGPISDYDAHVYASFWVNGAPGLVDTVGLTISNFNGTGALEAYDLGGKLLGSVFCEIPDKLCLSFPGRIHSVKFIPDNAVFDDFMFEGLNEVPVPAAVWLFGSGLVSYAVITRRFKK